jgi:hypothetical protein
LDEIAGSGELFDSGRKLSTLSDKLSTRSLLLPYSEFTLKIPSNANDVSFNTHPTGETLSDLALPFTAGKLSGYVSNRITGLAKLSCKWIIQAAKMFWQTTLGAISQHTMEKLRTETLQRYHSWWSHSKTLSFAKSFLSYLTKTKLETESAKGGHIAHYHRSRHQKCSFAHQTSRTRRQDIKATVVAMHRVHCAWRVHRTADHGDDVAAQSRAVSCSPPNGEACAARKR